MRTVASKETTDPSARSALTTTVRGVTPSLSAVSPVTEKVSVPSRPRLAADSPAGNYPIPR